MPANIRILLKKNFIVEKRFWKWTLLEVLIIVTFYTVIVVNPVVKSKNYLLELEDTKRTHFYGSHTSLYDLSAFARLQGLPVNGLRYGLIYTPQTPLTTRIVESTQKALQLRDSIGVENERSLFSHFNPSAHLAGVIFHNFTSTDDQSVAVPRKFSISLTFPSEFRTSDHSATMHRLWLTRCTGILSDYDTLTLKNVDLYLREGFLQLQHRLFMEWLRVLRQSTMDQRNISEEELRDATMGGALPLITAQSFKHHTNHEPCVTGSACNIIWFLYNFTFFVPFLGVIKRYAREQEENTATHHWLYGYEMGHHRIAHFLMSFLHFFALILIIYAFVRIEWSNLETYHLFRHVAHWIFLLFLTLYITTLIVYAMIVATVFENVINAMLFGVAMWLGSYGLFSIVLDSSDKVTLPVLLSMMIFFNNLYPVGMKIMKVLDSEPDYAQIWLIIYAQVVNILLLVFSLAVVDYFKPGRYKRRRYFNFLFIPYCCKLKGNNEIELVPSFGAVARPSVQNVEYGPMSADQEMLYLKNITTYKDYRRRVRQQQLKKVSMRFFKNEICVIIAPHAAGKTRLISMMAGWSKPHGGNIIYDGQYDIYENWPNYRTIVDVMMPNNALFDLLTVRETLCYMCEIKVSRCDTHFIQTEAEKWLQVLKSIIPVKNFHNLLVKTLSFSQKRLLALCCTLACQRRIILLDEPTLHMTLAEQRFFWDVLRCEKKNRAIIMTTISIDEADAVADRIVFLNQGKITASGTPFFLKTHYGIGFDLIILKDIQTSCGPITEMINTFIPNIVPENQIGDQLIYKLPSDQRPIYQRMLIEMEKRSKELGIHEIHMRGSDLNEIYMTLGLQDSKDVGQTTEREPILKFAKPTRDALRRQQKQAMLYKKMIYQAPNIVPVITIVPIFILILLINELTKTINCPSSINRGIQLGIPENGTTRELLRDFQECSYLEITEIESPKYQTKLNNKHLYFLFKSLDCGKRTYKEDVLTETGIYDKLGAVEIVEKGNHMILWINERIFHTAALALNLAHNLILRNLYPNETDILTTVVNKPMIIPLHVKINLIDNQIAHLRLPLTMGIIMPISVSCFVLGLVEERSSHLMTLQRLAGLPMDIFWSIGVLWDCATFFTFSIIYFVVMMATTIEGFDIVNKLLTLFLLNVHGVSALCGIYFMSLFLPDSKYRAFLITIILHFVFGLCSYVFYWDVMENNRLFYYALSMFPTFALLDGIANLYTASKEQEYCRERCDLVAACSPENMCSSIADCCNDIFFKWSSPGILPSVVFMLLSGTMASIGFFCVHLYRREIIHSTSPRAKQLGSVCYPSDDQDVVKEKVRIADMNIDECKKYPVLIDQVENRILKHGTLLNTISFAVESHSSLAIYGAHHCGKSNFLQQLIGDRSVSFGEMYFCGKAAKYQPSAVAACLGYCPQDGGLCDAFNPRQLFTFMFMMQGIDKVVASRKLRDITQSLNLRQYMNQRIALLPSNIRRKLSIGVCLIADNQVLIVDEPTRGMPAADRREIWNLLRSKRFAGNCIIFTSGDSLECESLADKIAVVDNGEMLAYGSAEYLRAKYSKGLNLEVKLLLDGSTAEETEANLEGDIENMLTFTKFLHQDSRLLNRFENTLKFHIPIENVRYSYLFGTLVKNQRRLNISDYTINLPSFSQVLDSILFTRKLRDRYKKKSHQKKSQHGRNAYTSPTNFLKNDDISRSPVDPQDLQNEHFGADSQRDTADMVEATLQNKNPADVVAANDTNYFTAESQKDNADVDCLRETPDMNESNLQNKHPADVVPSNDTNYFTAESQRDTSGMNGHRETADMDEANLQNEHPTDVATSNETNYFGTESQRDTADMDGHRETADMDESNQQKGDVMAKK